MVRRSLMFLTGVLAILTPARGDEGKVRFREQVAPILVENCLSCHNPKKAMGGYRVDTYARLMAESDGGRMIEPGQPEESVFFLLLDANQPSGRMPKEAGPLPEGEVAILRRWIEQGADRGGLDPDARLADLVSRTGKAGRP